MFRFSGVMRPWVLGVIRLHFHESQELNQCGVSPRFRKLGCVSHFTILGQVNHWEHCSNLRSWTRNRPWNAAGIISREQPICGFPPLAICPFFSPWALPCSSTLQTWWVGAGALPSLWVYLSCFVSEPWTQPLESILWFTGNTRFQIFKGRVCVCEASHSGGEKEGNSIPQHWFPDTDSPSGVWQRHPSERLYLLAVIWP